MSRRTERAAPGALRAATLAAALALAAPAPARAGDEPAWPSFRGPRASGVAEGVAAAVTWSAESGAGLAWRVEVPGLAHSSPVVAGGRAFVMTAVRERGPSELTTGLYGAGEPVADEGPHRFELRAYALEDGALVWERLAWEGVPTFPRHPKASYAASTPATDGALVVAFFGSEGLHAYTVDGEPRWKKDFGPLAIGPWNAPELRWGFASSPVLHDGKVIVQVDTLEESFVAALDAATGEELWRTAREEYASWCTPTVAEAGARTLVLCNGWKHVGGYDLADGAEVWKLSGGGDIPVPTPVVAHGLAFFTSAHGPLAPIYALPLEAEGELELSAESLTWFERRGGNYMQTPLVYGEELYSCRDNGALTCRDARTGAVHYTQRLGDGGTGFSASPVAADGKVYFTSEAGEVHVVAAGTAFELLSVNPMGEECMATPAVADGMLLWRTRGHLVAVAAPD